VSKLLIVEDEPANRALLQKRFETEGHSVLTAETGQQAQILCAATTPDVLLLDLSLPDMDGLDVLKKLRQDGFHVPILILSGRHSVDQRVEGLAAGADDYLGKPFAFVELKARVDALLRRNSFSQVTTLTCDDIVLNVVTRTATVNGQDVELQRLQFDVLAYLIKKKGQIVSRHDLALEVWHDEKAASTNLVVVQINLLRSKFKDLNYPLPLKTLRDVGYLMGSPPS
jgi:DNA-binding response OmpR family regulator